MNLSKSTNIVIQSLLTLQKAYTQIKNEILESVFTIVKSQNGRNTRRLVSFELQGCPLHNIRFWP
jgi:hypothetical protein